MPGIPQLWANPGRLLRFEGWPGGSGSGGRQRPEKIPFWLCPVLPERRARAVTPVGTGTAVPAGGVNGAVRDPRLGWDMANAVTRPPSRPRGGTRCGTRSTQFVIAFCIARMPRKPSRGRAPHLGPACTWGPGKPPKTSQPCCNCRQRAARRTRVGERCQGLGWKQPALCRSLPGQC